MVTRPDLAISYLLAVGAGFFGILVVGVLYPGNPVLDSTLVFALFCGILIAFGFFVSGLVLSRNSFHGARASRIAIWGTAGLGIPAFVVLLLMMVSDLTFVGLGWDQVVMLSIAGGGIVGILSGTLVELRSAHDRTWRLNQRNTVYLRMFRHDIRNSITVIQGHLELMRLGRNSPEEAIPTIMEQLHHIVGLSEAARTLDELDQFSTYNPIDIGQVTREQIRKLRSAHPTFDIEYDIADNALVSANHLISSVIEHIIRNAIEHHPDQAAIAVAIRQDPADSDWIELQVEDDGPGFSDDELSLHSKGFETALHHSDGIGLWLARWIVESFDGTLTLENTSRGSRVIVRLPAASEEMSSPVARIGSNILYRFTSHPIASALRRQSPQMTTSHEKP